MLTQHHLTAVAAIISFAHFINAIPTTYPPSPHAQSVLYSWSTEPVCTTTASETDCTTAYAALCARAELGVSDNTTVGDCTAFYWYDAGNTIPTAAECTAAYTQILAVSIGGALGYNVEKSRTNDPLYAIYPKDGNANCFKAAGDTSPVLAVDALPNGGGTLTTCPVSTSRRRRAIEVLEGRDQFEPENQNDGVIECAIEDGVWNALCTGVCLAAVTSTSWITGPFVVAGWLACLGGCGATASKEFNNCQKAKGNTDPDELLPLNPFGKRQEATESSNPCVNIKNWSYQCPTQETELLSVYSCQGTINT
ncbi:hypothetical protein HO133_011002 [Letharia lupina]|uniref:Uncharacterized protein n=1 Tax=Letharia lupina TaxID=560253 RepID=A0A8H6CJE2_9LECA|nr:uncharacterized protein HO133_011002 [Letharia lupina]KAF6224425.1 hypothetical protein HO133_011002 [Letharia lupina]